jgi:release factor glutamine methyltransferase
MKTVAGALLAFGEGLSPVYDKAEADSIKYIAFSHITGLSKAQLRAFPEREITTAQAAALNQILASLQTGQPIQYVLGETEFYGLPFKVTPAVLIPRPETEELVEWVLLKVNQNQESRIKNQERKAESGKQKAERTLRILDIGTGSGCIPIALKKHLPEAEVSAIDISKEALNIAQQNANLNGVKIEFIEADILNPKIAICNTRYAILTSNPPYVTEREKAEMHGNVLNHEPHLALFVSDENPLLFYRAIADFALEHLEKDGLLFLEINENLGPQTVDLLKQKGFTDVQLRQDMRGKDRMIKACR